MLRDDRLKHSWEVQIKPFLLSRYLITRELYALVAGENPYTLADPNKPVDSVTWMDAIEFCNKLSGISALTPCYILDNEHEIIFNPESNGYRLPVEAEWEYACKAGTTGHRYGKIDEIAWYKENSGGHSHEVGTLKPNDWGIYDMLGNVWEWCNDIYDERVYGSYRIIRGGGWNDEERGILATNRRRSHPLSFKIDDLGFRVARSA